MNESIKLITSKNYLKLTQYTYTPLCRSIMCCTVKTP